MIHEKIKIISPPKPLAITEKNEVTEGGKYKQKVREKMKMEGTFNVPVNQILQTITQQFQDDLAIIPLSGWENLLDLLVEHGNEEMKNAIDELKIPMAPIMLWSALKESHVVDVNGQPVITPTK